MLFSRAIISFAQMTAWEPGRRDLGAMLGKPAGTCPRLFTLFANPGCRLWSRLVLHFWATAIDDEIAQFLASDQTREPDPITTLQTAYEQTLEATVSHDCLGTTTTCGAQLHYKISPEDVARENPSPLLFVTNLGDCKVLVVRPRNEQNEQVVYRTKEQWHWFDCPRQLGTNSPDTPRENAVLDKVDLEVGDIVLAMSDGVTDNLWEHEIVSTVLKSVQEWELGQDADAQDDRTGGRNGGMDVAARDLVAAATKIAKDPFAESPFMEHAIEEGLASEGGEYKPWVHLFRMLIILLREAR